MHSHQPMSKIERGVGIAPRHLEQLKVEIRRASGGRRQGARDRAIHVSFPRIAFLDCRLDMGGARLGKLAARLVSFRRFPAGGPGSGRSGSLLLCASRDLLLHRNSPDSHKRGYRGGCSGMFVAMQ